MLKAVIFDFDGVILDTEHDRFLELQQELKKYRFNLTKKDFHLLFGKKTREFLNEIFPNLPRAIADKLIENRRNSLRTRALKLSMVSGVKGIIRYLSSEYRLAITTGSPREVVENVLNHSNLTYYFSLIVSGENFKSSKPDPECYLVTLKKLNLRPSEVVIIEDSQAGIIAGHKAGCKVFALQNAYNKKQIKEADMIFKSHKEILKYFRSI